MAVVCISVWPSRSSTNVRSRVSQTRSAIMSIAVSRSSVSHIVELDGDNGPWSCRPGCGQQLEAVRTLRAQPPAGHRRFRVAFDRDQLAVAVVDELAASDGTVRADRAGGRGAVMLRRECACPGAPRLKPRPIRAVQDLLDQRPTVKKLFHHGLAPQNFVPSGDRPGCGGTIVRWSDRRTKKGITALTSITTAIKSSASV